MVRKIKEKNTGNIILSEQQKIDIAKIMQDISGEKDFYTNSEIVNIIVKEMPELIGKISWNEIGSLEFASETEIKAVNEVK